MGTTKKNSRIQIMLILTALCVFGRAAAAQTMGASARATGATGVTGVSGANLGRATGVSAISALSPSALTLSSVLAAPSVTPSALLNAAVIPAASAVSPIAAKSDVLPLSVKAVAPATSAIATLKTALSAPSVQSAADKPARTQAALSRKLFDGEALRTDLSAPAVQANDEARSVRAALAKKVGKGMPTPAVLERYRRLLVDEKSMTDYLDPGSEANRAAGYPSGEVVDMMLKDLSKVHGEKRRMEKAHPGLAFWAKGGPIGRAWARRRAWAKAYAPKGQW